jgi:hypothetical protein
LCMIYFLIFQKINLHIFAPRVHTNIYMDLHNFTFIFSWMWMKGLH